MDKRKLLLLMALFTARIAVCQDYRLVWSDEFDVDGKPSADWTYEQGFQRNEELQWYQPQNAEVKDGCLVIEGRKERVENPRYKAGSSDWRTNRKYAEYTSACLTTRLSHQFMYGRIEVRAKIPTATGSWPAIWLLGNKWEWPMNGEIDMMEYYIKNGQPSILANACWSSDKKWTAVWDDSVTPFTHFTAKDKDWADKFHIWRMDWDKAYIRLYLDDELLNEIDLSQTCNQGYDGNYENPFNTDAEGFGHYFLLNLALGSNGGQPDDTAFPLKYYVDYVRVYQKAEQPTEKDMGAYLFTYFNDPTHSLFMAISYDGYTFTAINGSDPIISGDSIADQRGIRDPHIYRAPNGRFYIAMTDLHVFGKQKGLRTTQWERPDKYGWGNNRGLVLMASDDLIHWTHHEVHIDELFPEKFGEIGCAWAPQTIWDPEAGKLMVYFTIRQHAGGRTKLYYCYANEDFTTLETEPQLLFEYPDEKIQVLDADICPMPDGRYFMTYVAQENPGGIKYMISDKINHFNDYHAEQIDGEDRGCEAPNVWKRIGEDKWVIMYDIYSVNPHNFGFVETSDFKTFKPLGRFNEGVMKAANFVSPKHGSVIHITKAEARRLEQYWASQPKNKSIRSGALWLDDSGRHINAHGGGIMKHGDTYYWFGEHKADTTSSAMVGVMCYASKDLVNWRNCGVALSVSDQRGSDIERGCILERPKVIYNKVTKKFCMWFHLELKGKGYSAARYGVAVSDRPEGPYKFLYSQRANPGTYPVEFGRQELATLDTLELDHFKEWWKPDWYKAIDKGLFVKRDFGTGQMARDMTLYIDDDGKAYHIFSSEDNLTLHITELTNDYLHHSGRYTRVASGGQNEAPAIFKKDGTYWMITSGCTGWAPNEARMFSAPSIWGPWTQHPNPCIGPKQEITFGGQSTYILPIESSNQFIFMADIWRPRHPSDARYIWLPIEFEGGKPVIRWRDAWDFDELEQK